MFQMFHRHRKGAGSGMVLYCAAIPVRIYPLLMHKMGMNPDKDAVLIIDQNEYAKRTDIDSIRKFKVNGIFSDVIECDIFSVRKDVGSNPKQRYIEYFDDIFSESGYQIANFDEIYVLNDSWDGDLNLYFNFKEIEYVWIDVAKDYIPYPWGALEWWKKIMDQYKALTPFAKYAKPCLLTSSKSTMNQLKTNKKEYFVWDLESIYKSLSEKNIETVGKCFSIDELPDPSNGSLIIKNSGAVCNGNAFEKFEIPGWGKNRAYIRLISGAEQYHMDNFTPFFDKIALDFYAPDSKRVYIKEHPNCPLNEIQKEIYHEDVITFTRMPFEILIRYFSQRNIKFNTVIGYLSTSLLALNDSICDHLYILGREFLRTSLFYSSIYTALCYANYQNFKCIYCSELIKTQLEQLLRTVDFSIELKVGDLNKIGDMKDALIISDYVLERSKLNYDFWKRVPNTSAICFLNVDITDDFFDDSTMPNFIPVEIKKEKISEGFLNLQRDELLWIYSKSTSVLKGVRFFQMEKILPRCGLRIYVEESTLASGVALFREYSQRRKMKELSSQCKELSSQIEGLTEALKKVGDTKLLTSLLQMETDVCRYIELLSKLQSEYLVLLSVRDTPGSRLPDKAVQLLHEFGFTKFSKELWQMYIGVSWRGKILCDMTGEKREAPVSYQDCYRRVNISISSMAWRQGNKAEILIDGVDHAVNIRGLNFVVYNINKNEVVDSIGFDYHGDQKCFKRKVR